MVHEQWSARINSELNNIYFIIWALKFRPYILIQYLFGLRHIQNCKAHRRDSWVQSYYKLSNNFIKQAGDISYLECNIHKFDRPNIFSLNRIHTRARARAHTHFWEIFFNRITHKFDLICRILVASNKCVIFTLTPPIVRVRADLGIF